MILGAVAIEARAGTVRMWPSAVVVGDPVRLSDLCELRGLPADEERKLTDLVITEAPPPGGSLVLHIGAIRTALAASGTNMAKLTLAGATQCELSRPANLAPAPTISASTSATRVKQEGTPRHGGANAGGSHNGEPATEAADAQKPAEMTLRRAVIENLNTELARYGGTAEVIFDRTSEQVLDLSGPAYEFRIRRRDASPLGLCPLEVDVVAAGRTVQTVPLVLQVTMLRRVVVARRAINQGATILAADVEAAPLTFTRLDRIGIEDASFAVGQRAKRFIPAGSVIEGDVLEAVPLVLRGQLVTLTSASGAIRVVTTGKAAADGLRGEVIKVRAADDKHVEFDAVVVGPGEVRVGAGTQENGEAKLALGDRR